MLSHPLQSVDPNSPSKSSQEDELVTFDGKLLDRVYLDAPDYTELNVGTGAAVAISTKQWQDVVVWNPGETMKACCDEFVCVEQAVAEKVHKVEPGETWTATAFFTTVDV